MVHSIVSNLMAMGVPKAAYLVWIGLPKKLRRVEGSPQVICNMGCLRTKVLVATANILAPCCNETWRSKNNRNS